MKPHVAAALSALPADLAPERVSLAQAVEHGVPLGRLQRGWILGALPARIALGYLAHRVREHFGPADERARRAKEAHLAAALRMLATMTYLRGMVHKLGQAIASYPTLLPEEFADTLASLHFEAPPMHLSLLRERLRDELGGEPEQVFARFETRAFAAASLGQVHRARLLDGTEVAVKVQYPGIARTIRDDFRNLVLVTLPLRFGSDRSVLHEQLEDMREMLERETDYAAEARATEAARERLADLPEVVVPRVHSAHSTARVLTTDLLRGVHLAEFLRRDPPQAERDRLGRVLLHAFFRLLDRYGMIHADPHPGNVLFLDDGRVGLIDFGSFRELDQEEWRFEKLMERAFRGDEHAYREGMLLGLRYDAGMEPDPEHWRLSREYCEWLWEPLRRPGPFDFGGDYFPRGMRLFQEITASRHTRSHPVNIWINRNFIGVRALLYSLRARVDAHELNERELGTPAAG